MITVDDVYKRAVDIIHKNLQNDLGSKYGAFINIMEKYNLSINGQYISQCLLDEDWNADILFNVPHNRNELMDMISNFESIGKIKNYVALNWNRTHKSVHCINIFENNKSVNIYYSDYIVFQLSLICRDKMAISNKESKLKIYKLNNLMHKQIVFDICGDTVEIGQCKQLGFNCNFRFSCDCVEDIMCRPIYLLVYRDDGMFVLHGKSFLTTKSGRISCDPIPMASYDLVYVDIELKQFSNECIFTGTCDDDYPSCFDNCINCPFQYTPHIGHFHSCEFFVKGNKQYVQKIIIVKYEDTNEFSYFSKQFDNMDGVCSMNNIDAAYDINNKFLPDIEYPFNFFGLDDTYRDEINTHYGNDFSGFRPDLV